MMMRVRTALEPATEKGLFLSVVMCDVDRRRVLLRHGRAHAASFYLPKRWSKGAAAAAAAATSGHHLPQDQEPCPRPVAAASGEHCPL